MAAMKSCHAIGRENGQDFLLTHSAMSGEVLLKMLAGIVTRCVSKGRQDDRAASRNVASEP
jgi:hypothetical protein